MVCKPYSQKRAYACFEKLMPEYKGIIVSKNITCTEYHQQYFNKLSSKDEWVHVLVGDIQRMKVFAKKGYQIEMEMPDNVWEAYEELVKRGYNEHIFSEDFDTKIVFEEMLKEIKK